ncbi:MAG: hypothetical protein A2504_04500 [Bdellovibrionales bacterium RIFOXYD12_FULL_39_22]|nr:MAG: hypothetical protein A2385_07325 [Bdellovibrionales bacterium RIFOXYB1_FULL_39_21]OFZ42072.1 MAG: hypothetical protein A2485_09295 [Bdellovibrionales bacterium RIFOXYC12_FULL_39_17]OFZ50788.1 MAG: hypothetical protein A2404_06245 [Bdellovibrionales bacterium RIFOXYC1_FULL_39_130]OFZ78011.1 MAG: hypothetical protein A2560_01415 [Bdellovibrionales bacterium RIFOXYD1_FULL_39_84]OFZ93553.1 MAG: hypothetical protein A2504_04500 [Bdellovibrionales bacterium RIFOXYD12_FULL_39_22]HLE10324.1 hy
MIEETGPVKFKIYGQQQAIANRQRADDTQYIPDEYKAFARDQEKQFVQMMLEQMNNSVPKNGLGLEGENGGDNSAMNYYNSILTSEHADVMSKKDGGLGVQKMILDQLYPHSRRNPIAYNAYLEQKNQMAEGRAHARAASSRALQNAKGVANE